MSMEFKSPTLRKQCEVDMLGKMVVVQLSKKLLGVPERWRRQYQKPTGEWQHGNDKRMIYEGLAALDPKTMTAEQVDEIIGNSTWTMTRCDACGENKEIIVEFYGRRDDGSTYYLTQLCTECMQTALVKADKAAEE